jgi:alpha-L-rhamnosidase
VTEFLEPVPAVASEIRRAARAFDPDPFGDSPGPVPGAPTGCWAYRRGQFELARLSRLVTEGFAANRSVHYARNFGELLPRVRFRRALSGTASRFMLRSTGAARALVDGMPLLLGGDGSARLPAGSVELEVEVSAAAGEPAAVLVRGDDVFAAGGEWQTSLDGVGREPASCRGGGDAAAPHIDREPTVSLTAELVDGVFELPVPVLGRPVIECEVRPRIRSGESREEATAAEIPAESRHEVVQLPDGRWTAEHELGFRYLTVAGVNVRSVRVDASVHAVGRRGAFVCADERLNRIWASSAFTLRTCMHDLMLDGIKRDRMPWIGDLALTTIANAYAFGESGIVRDSAAALGSPRHGYVNGISDYSLWWLINSASMLRYFGPGEHVASEAQDVHRFVERLAEYAGPGGIFRPRTEPDGFSDANEGSIFLDWGVRVAEGKDLTALQMLWYWALRSAADVLRHAGHDSALRWERLAGEVRGTLEQDAWDESTQCWAEYLGAEGSSPYPNFLAVLSGLSPAPCTPEILASIAGADSRIGTPFMASFALRARILAGDSQGAVETIRRRWGEMLDAGAITFWEEFADPGADPLAMYGRPFGKSLCHAWASGPAALLPEAILGIRPLSPGWSRFELNPELGPLPWAAAVVPTPLGDIAVSAVDDAVTVDVPPGAELVRGGDSWHGPCSVEWRGDARAWEA